MSKFIRSVEADDVVYVRYRCPGCGHDHAVPAERWHWNGDVDKPTLSPSVRHFYEYDGKRITTCHYHVVNGQIKFCNDCPHPLSGKTVDLPEITE